MTRIYIEAKHERTSEAVFIKTLLLSIGKDENQYELICVDGKDNLANVSVKMREATLEDINNIIIFDADFPDNNGGYLIRKSEIESMLQTLSVQAAIFLFPNNHEDGDVETLLERIMQKNDHQRFFDCYHDYENCLGDMYISPNRKGKLHTYISAQKGLTKKQRNALGSGHWCFDDKRYWDIDNMELEPLKEFLNLYVS